MFCLPMQIDAQHGVDLVAAGKGGGAEIGEDIDPLFQLEHVGLLCATASPASLQADLELTRVTCDKMT